MKTLTPSERRALRAKAHHLVPVVSIGQHGLTENVMKEIEISLRAHELLKIRMFGDDRAAREEAMQRICAELDAAPVQHLGKLLIVWRPAPVAEPAATAGSTGKPSTTKRPARTRSSTVVLTAKAARPGAKPTAKSTGKTTPRTARRPSGGTQRGSGDEGKRAPVALQRRRRAASS